VLELGSLTPVALLAELAPQLGPLAGHLLLSAIAALDGGLSALVFPFRCSPRAATPERAKQPPGAQRVSCDEPQPELQASSPRSSLVIERPRAPGLQQQLDRLIDEPDVRASDPLSMVSSFSSALPTPVSSTASRIACIARLRWL
jgi:hypothetical protein